VGAALESARHAVPLTRDLEGEAGGPHRRRQLATLTGRVGGEPVGEAFGKSQVVAGVVQGRGEVEQVHDAHGGTLGAGH
jgi:hypothetical protein